MDNTNTFYHTGKNIFVLDGFTHAKRSMQYMLLWLLQVKYSALILKRLSNLVKFTGEQTLSVPWTYPVAISYILENVIWLDESWYRFRRHYEGGQEKAMYKIFGVFTEVVQ